MRFFAAMLAMQLKRLARRSSTLLCLLAAPVLALALGLAASSGEDMSVRVGVLLPQNSAYAPAIWHSLAQSGQDVQFVQADTQQQLEDMVAAGQWECGYLLPQSLDDKLANGQYARLVTRVDGPATSLGAVLDWTVSAAVLDSCAATMANGVLAQQGVLPPRDAEAYTALAEEMFTDKTLLAMDIVPVNGAVATDAQGSASLTAASLVRGMLALMLLLFSCLCAVWFARDMQAGFFTRLRPYEGTARLYLPSFGASAVLAAGAGLLTLLAGSALFPGYFGGFGRQAALLLCYLLPLGAFSFLLSMLFAGRELLVGVLPFIMMACLILCPVLVDLSAFIPWLGAVSALLPPTVYLRAASGAGTPWGMLLQAAGYAALGLAVGALKKKL